jgi:hypothetical protein
LSIADAYYLESLAMLLYLEDGNNGAWYSAGKPMMNRYREYAKECLKESAGMVESVDTGDLKSPEVTRTGSSPVTRTKHPSPRKLRGNSS